MENLEPRRLFSVGQPDPSFDPAALARHGAPIAIAQTPDGGLIAVHWSFDEFQLSKLLPNGAFDPTFGDGGVAISNLHPAEAYSNDVLAVSNTGRIALIAFSQGGTVEPLIEVFRADGSLDPQFGQNGIVPSGGVRWFRVAFQDDGKVVLLGYKPDVGLVVQRLLGDGALDPQFAQDGTATIPGVRGGDMVIASDGDIVISYSTYSAQYFSDDYIEYYGLSLHRFNPDGTTDLDGTRDIDAAVDESVSDIELTALSDGAVMLVEHRDAYPVWRIEPDGSSTKLLNFPGIHIFPTEAAVDAKGRIVVTGTYLYPGGRNCAMRYLPDGTLDKTWGNQGLFISDDDKSFHRVLRNGDVALGSHVLRGGDEPPARISLSGGELLLRGTSASETFRVAWRHRDDRVVARIDGLVQSFAPARVARIRILADTGDDQINIGAGAPASIIEAGDGSDTIAAGDGGDLVRGGSGRDEIFGGGGNDTLLGGGGRDYLLGGAGADRLFGNGGYDTLSGGGGNDRLFGRDEDASPAGADVLRGGDGTDWADDDTRDLRDTIEKIIALI